MFHLFCLGKKGGGFFWCFFFCFAPSKCTVLLKHIRQENCKISDLVLSWDLWSFLPIHVAPYVSTDL